MELQQHGIIPGRLDTDWLGGSIPYEVRNPSGDWYPYVVQGEHQSWGAFDCMGCVSFAVDNICEIQIKHQTGVEVNDADRFLAKVSGTTQQGNRVSTVLLARRDKRNVREIIWPTPTNPTWDSYYAPIPKTIQDQALKTAPIYDLQWEYIVDHDVPTVQYHLKQAPLLVTIPGHEITAISCDDHGMLTVLDDYLYNLDPINPFIHKIKLTDVTDIYKAVLTVKGSMAEFIQIGGTQTYGLLYTTEFVDTVVKFSSKQDAQEKLKNIPGALKPDGSPDFLRARVINL